MVSGAPFAQALCKESDVGPAIESLQAGLSGLSNNVAALQVRGACLAVCQPMCAAPAAPSMPPTEATATAASRQALASNRIQRTPTLGSRIVTS